MTSTAYRTVATEAWAEIEVERSRFRCLLARVDDEGGARGVVEVQRRDHWNAQHHAHAVILGPDGAVERSSDDGEPSGTAGAPMLDVLRGAGVSDVIAVTTRWFGGVLLGTGGLARAYADSVRAALGQAGLVDRVLMEECEVTVDLAVVGRLEHELRARGTQVLGVDYTDMATVRLAVPPQALAIIEEAVEELTGGEASLFRTGSEWVDVS
ncbi:MAG TPA: YigZ family protein [Marmoricola sp.]|jgi:uncharacterized YigZ family protein|nr:YigZ family protein [Marmoricola sp.]